MKTFIKYWLLVWCSILAVTIVFFSFFQLNKVSGPSMSLTIKDGDFILGCEIFNSIERFDIVTIHLPDGKIIVKRIIGLPGETVHIYNGNVYIDGNLLDDVVSNITFDEGTASVPLALGNNEFFVLGDNRINSFDSRAPECGVILLDWITAKIIGK